MKKAIALVLALVLALGAVACGTSAPATTEAPAATETPAATEAPATTEAPAAATETPAAAPAATETPAAPAATEAPAANALRAGESVSVATKEEFVAAYAKLYEDGSTINEIKLTDNIDINSKDTRAEGGKDPYLKGFETYVVVRMPDGTQLDLNGCTLKCRAIAGYDWDESTGAKSGKYTLGNIVDSFGGGTVILTSMVSGAWFNVAMKLAKACPFVSAVCANSNMKDAEKYDYVVPENVQLILGSEKSEINANSITFKSGATLVVKKDEAPGIKGTKAIIFECKNDADKTRAGTEYATEIKDV